MSQEIAITADPVSLESCRFTVDRPVYSGGSVYFANRKKAKGSSLAERLFEIENVVGVMISGDVVTVTQTGVEEWSSIGKKIGMAIRAHLASGLPAVSEEVRTWVPPTEEIRTKVEELLENEINPGVAGHGGHVSLVDVKGNAVYLQLGGGCQGCGMADVTLKQGIERLIRERVPEVGEILDTTDHAGGRNPYYAPSKG